MVFLKLFWTKKADHIIFPRQTKYGIIDIVTTEIAEGIQSAVA